MTRRGRVGPGGWLLLPVLVVLLVAAPARASAQDKGASLQSQLQDSRRRLEKIRAERDRLQREMQSLDSRARNVNGELRNIERQISASHSALAEIDLQSNLAAKRVQSTTADLLRTRERLQEAKAMLQRRLRDIYERGPLQTVRVLLGADSFADLLNRYHYLQLIATYDQTLVERVEDLEKALASQNQELKQSVAELGRLRQSKLGEVAELQNIQSEHRRTLRQFRSRERKARSRLDEIAQDEKQLTGLIGDLEQRRKEAERRAVVAGRRKSERRTLGTAAMGTLPWPVDGRILYRFGRDRQPNGTVLRWNGIGIGAPAGTPVKAVRAGTVVLAGAFEGYGPTVVLSHGGGFYTLYLYLQSVNVSEGREVQAGDVLGTVGGTGTPEGPHMEFQIRAPVQGNSPQAMDPLRWLRARKGR